LGGCREQPVGSGAGAELILASRSQLRRPWCCDAPTPTARSPLRAWRHATGARKHLQAGASTSRNLYGSMRRLQETLTSSAGTECATSQLLLRGFFSLSARPSFLGAGSSGWSEGTSAWREAGCQQPSPSANSGFHNYTTVLAVAAQFAACTREVHAPSRLTKRSIP
jgi:hypothetical protein